MIRPVSLLGALALAAGFGVSQQQQQQADSTAQTGSVSERGARGQIQIMREVFTYSPRGRRDPMASLMSSPDIRPLITEIEVISILYTGSASTSLAVLRHLSANPEIIYRVKVGDALGRMRVTAIEPYEVVFTLDEFGFSRTERLSVKPDTTARTP